MLKLPLSIMIMGMMFCLANHPLTLALILILNTALISLMSGENTLTYWYSFMLFMIMIGGVLVLIVYMTSIASNEKLDPMWKFLVLGTSMFLVMLMAPDMYNPNLTINTMDTMPFTATKINLSLNKYITPSNSMTIILMINYLLMALIAIVKITSIGQGALRQKF